MKIESLSFVRYLFVWVVVLCTLLGCTSKATTLPEDMPLSEFMIGEWKVISRFNTDTGEALEIVAPTISISSDVLSYGDTFNAEYNFIEEDMIFVNNLRLTGGETWRLERDGEHLIVYQEFQDFRSIIRLERSKR